MAKGIRNLSSWMEVAPAPIIFPTKPSNSPALETITEEVAEEHNDKASMNTLLNVVMAKEISKFLASYTEFAPAPVIRVRKISHAPMLETIAEEAQECDQQFCP
ncbi:hypothetical protein VNO78_20859 [Psophocarpus tetragonolobus]|uniref:Uncharacterized protein n=1 Tax=Psophocarpus tetragonolobus TaxID=3891 RepID=A0AAN9SC69_PSOTE